MLGYSYNQLSYEEFNAAKIGGLTMTLETALNLANKNL